MTTTPIPDRTTESDIIDLLIERLEALGGRESENDLIRESHILASGLRELHRDRRSMFREIREAIEAVSLTSI